MKPCSNRRKAIAMLALGEVEGQEAEELRSHLQSCEGCRCYSKEISAMTKKVATMERSCDVEASEAFHRRVMSRVRGEKPKLSWGIARIFGLNWRVALPATVTAGCAVLLLWIRFGMNTSNVAPIPFTPGVTHMAAARDANARTDVPPTLGNYQTAANQSLQKFDALLNRESMEANSGGPIYRVSELTMADGGQ